MAAGNQNGRTKASAAPCGSLSSGAEMEDGVLLGGNGRSVTRGGMEVPVVECDQNSLVEFGAQALQNRLGGNLSPLVDCYFDHDVSFRVRQFPRIGNGIGRCYRQCRSYFVAVELASSQSSVGKSC